MSIRRNATYNLLGSIVPLAMSLVTIPIYLGLIGEARYGVLAVAWLLLGYFGLFDLGLGRAVAQRIAALKTGSADERAKAFWTALVLNIGLGVIGGLLIWPIANYFFGDILKVEDALRPEIESAVPWLVMAVPMATLSGVLTGALQGRERFVELNLISVLGTLLFQLLPLFVAALEGPGLGLILPAALFARLITLVILFEACRRQIFRGHAASFVRSQAKQLLGFGGWVTVSSFIGPMMVILDRFIIGALLGANAVTYYTVPFQLSERSTIVSNALTSAVYPRFASMSPDEERHLAAESLRALAVVVTPLTVVGILLMGPFLALWISQEFADRSTVIGQVVLLGFWVNGFAKIPYAQLQARARPDLVALCHLGEVLPFFALLYFGLSTFGLIGAAIAFSVRVVADFALLANFAGILLLALRILLIPSALVITAFVITLHDNTAQPEWLLLISLHLLLTAAWAFRSAPAAIRETAASQLILFRKFLQKLEMIKKN